MVSSRPENGFVADFAGFLRLFANRGVTSFLSRRYRRQAMQTRPSAYLEDEGMADVSHFIAGTRPGTDIGERTWVKSSDLYQGQSSSACVSAEKAARETAASCRRQLPSPNRAIKRVSWQTAEA
jgi:hypothetical protein